MDRVNNFISANKNSPLIRHTETMITSQGRRLSVRQNSVDKWKPRAKWRYAIHQHREFIFFSDLGNNPLTDEDN